MPKGHSDARQKLVDTERLGHVVVGAEVERVYLVGFATASREHDDRRARVLADPTHDLEAVTVGQVEIEHDEIGLPPLVARDRIARGLSRLDLKAMPAEVRSECPDHRRLVVDDEETSPRRLRAHGLK